MAKSIFGMGLNPFWKSSHRHSKEFQDNFLDYLNNCNPTKMTLKITHAKIYVSFPPLFLFWEEGMCPLNLPFRVFMKSIKPSFHFVHVALAWET